MHVFGSYVSILQIWKEMDETQQEIQDIILRTLLGQSSEEDLEWLDGWCNKSSENREFYDRISNRERIRLKLDDYAKIDVWKAFVKNQRMLRQRQVRRLVLRSLPYAAVLVVGFCTFLLLNNEKPESPVIPVSVVTEIPAGTKQAELVLASGEKIHLTGGQNTKLKEGNSEIIISGDKINYKKGCAPVGEVFNVIRTPLGGEYTITLSDGTVVWLNAMSELKYPVDFMGDKRVVKLTGEAYFDVKPDASKAFIVEVEGYQIKVLGTSFNVSSYKDDARIYTTLCRGKVNVLNCVDHRQKVLVPGEQLVCDLVTGRMDVKKVDVNLYTAWMRGRFEFDNHTVEDMFAILQRWYDVQVFYANQQAREQVFTGTLPRFDNLNTILNIMEEISDVRFDLKRNTLFVK